MGIIVNHIPILIIIVIIINVRYLNNIGLSKNNCVPSTYLRIIYYKSMVDKTTYFYARHNTQKYDKPSELEKNDELLIDIYMKKIYE